MEEGRRMFQIFAARMFEQRVLQAYREKVARERQAKLMEEEEEELRKEEARREKKAKEAQKKKEKAAQKKAALAEEKARKEAEKAAEEEAKRQEEARKAEEAKRKAEEKRKKKEAQRKAEDEERARKEAEKQRQKQLQAEQERKAKEAKEREKKAREEARLQKEKEAREQKEREARERELRSKDEIDKRQRENEAKASKPESKASQKQQKQQQEERAAKKAAALATPVTMSLPKRPAQHTPNPALPVLPQQPAATSFASPKPSVATPALPKAPTTMKPRQTSQQDGASSAPGTASVSESASQSQSPNASTPAPQSPVLSAPPSHRGSVASHHSTNISSTISPLQSATARFPPTSQPSQLNLPPVGMSFPPGFHHPIPPGFGNPIFAPAPPGFRQPPPGVLPPGLSSPILGRGYPAPVPPPGFAQPTPEPMAQFSAIGSKDANPGTHSRHPSGGFESPSIHAAQPIGRPTPIGRPASIVQVQRPHSGSPSAALPNIGGDAEDHLGSSALLDDSEDVVSGLPEFASGPRRGFAALGRPPPAFPPLPFGDPGILQQSQSPWGPSPIQPPGMNPFTQAPPPGFWPVTSPTPGFSAPLGIRQPAPSRQPASVVRQKLCNVCRDLAVQDPATNGFIPLSSVHEAIKDQIEFNPLGNGPLTDHDILALCETEGTMVNGGGNFDIREDGSNKSIRWNREKTPPLAMGGGGFGAPGQIGSPVLGSSFGR